MHTRLTLDLNADWDIHLNEAGNIATLIGPGSTAQNVANECRLFTRDAYFNFYNGLPHKLLELGQRNPPTPLLRTLMRRGALRVPDVAEVLGVTIDDFDKEKRLLTGRIEVRTREGGNVAVDL